MVASLTEKIKAAPPSAPKPRAHWLRTAAVFLLWQVIAILFVEFVLFCAGLGEEEIFSFDQGIGFTHMHNKRITWRSEGFAQSYLNDDGMREPGLTIEKPAHTYRVAVLGDSMVESFHVPIEKTFGEIIARRLSPLDGKRVQWLNFGTSGYSTVQEFLQLKRQVMKYNPDLVIVCYNSRDMFENWTAPDEVITNVRPYAVHFPGHPLVIVDQPVRRWLRSPRGQFMRATSWFRHHSHIAGLMAALDLEMSQHDPWYRAFVDVFAHPKIIVDAVAHPKILADNVKQLIAGSSKGGPSFQINFFEGAPKPIQPASPGASATADATAAKKRTVDSAANSASNNSALSKTIIGGVANTAPARKNPGPMLDQTVYHELVTRMLTSLFTGMRQTCTEGGAEFAVMNVPVRAQLCPLPGSETSFAGLDYDDELSIVRSVCTANNIPYCDVEQAAEMLPAEKRPELFYAVHLTPQGQQFVADCTQPFVRDLIGNLSHRQTGIAGVETVPH